VVSLDFASENPSYLAILLGGATCIITLFNIDLTDMISKIPCWIVPKSRNLVQPFWKYKQFFWPILYTTQHTTVEITSLLTCRWPQLGWCLGEGRGQMANFPCKAVISHSSSVYINCAPTSTVNADSCGRSSWKHLAAAASSLHAPLRQYKQTYIQFHLMRLLTNENYPTTFVYIASAF